MQKKKLISIVAPTYNEELVIEDFYARLIAGIDKLNHEYKFEIIIIDNYSEDTTIEKLRKLAKEDQRLKLIINSRNFGHIRSPYYGILNATGDAVIYLASDLQDPPELIPEFLSGWEDGYKLVMAVKPISKDSNLFHFFRKTYYRFLDLISEIPVIRDSTGFGLYDKIVIETLNRIADPYPFLRGLVAEMGYKTKLIPFVQERRERGISKNNFYSLYDIAWLGLINHSKIPARLSSFMGIIIGVLSLLIGAAFFVLKLVFWDSFPLGIAPLIIGIFFLFGLQFIFIGIIGEYVSTILIYVQRRPIVVEQERVNFDNASD